MKIILFKIFIKILLSVNEEYMIFVLIFIKKWKNSVNYFYNQAFSSPFILVDDINLTAIFKRI